MKKKFLHKTVKKSKYLGISYIVIGLFFILFTVLTIHFMINYKIVNKKNADLRLKNDSLKRELIEISYSNYVDSLHFVTLDEDFDMLYRVLLRFSGELEEIELLSENQKKEKLRREFERTKRRIERDQKRLDYIKEQMTE